MHQLFHPREEAEERKEIDMYHYIQINGIQCVQLNRTILFNCDGHINNIFT